MDGQNQSFQVSNSPTDPTVSALMKSIGLVESNGNYNAVGDGGNSLGAYQISKQNWQNWAGQYLGDPNAPTTPQNQDKVAYNQIANLASQGYKQSQIASIWNSGKADPTGNVGVNAQGTSYNTPEYVKTTGDYYNEIMQGNDSPASNPGNEAGNDKSQNDPGFWSNLLGLVSLPGAAAINYGIGHAGALGTVGAGIISNLALGGPEDPVADIVATPLIEKGLGGLMPSSSSQTSPGGGSAPVQQSETPLAQLPQQAQQAAPQSIVNAITQSLGTTIKGRNLITSPEGQSGINTVAAFNALPTVQNGVQNSIQAIEKINNLESETEKFGQEVVDSEKAQGSFKGWADNTKSIISQDRHIRPEEHQAAFQLVDDVVQANQGKKEDNAALGTFQNIKRTYASAFDKGGNALNTRVLRHLSRGAREEVKKHMKHPDAYDAYLKMEQNFINAKKVLKQMHNRKAPKHKSLKKDIARILGNAAAAHVGNKLGGPIGAITAYLIEKKVAKSIDKRYGASVLETKPVKKALAKLKGQNPAAYELLKRRSTQIAGELKKQPSPKRADFKKELLPLQTLASQNKSKLAEQRYRQAI